MKGREVMDCRGGEEGGGGAELISIGDFVFVLD